MGVEHEEAAMEAEAMDLRATGTDGSNALRQMATERLAAHRHRRAGQQAAMAAAEAEAHSRQRQARSASRAVQEAVAARYSNSVSYHEFLAIEAERAIAQAQAEAEVAARNAQAVAEAQMQLLEQLEQWRQTDTSPRQRALDERASVHRHDLADAMADIAQAATELLVTPAPRIELVPSPAAPHADTAAEALTASVAAPRFTTDLASSGVTVRLFEELGAGLPEAALKRSGAEDASALLDSREAAELDEEIDFRREPQFGDFRMEPVAIPANVIEFPRPIVAERKQRPHRAEGPLAETPAPGAPQLRIFEVEPERLLSAATEPLSAPVWQDLVLPAHHVQEHSIPLEAQVVFTHQPDAAPMSQRAMAGLVDLSLLGAGFVAFVAVAAHLAGGRLHGLPLPVTAGTLAAVMVVMVLGYLLLFFTFAEATPGMRYARIGLCTFGERYPTRAELRRRIVATALAALPLGLGLLWAALDDEGLGWHDRISRMYQRSY